jgi:cell division protein FtsZ
MKKKINLRKKGDKNQMKKSDESEPKFLDIPIHPVRNLRNRKNDKLGLSWQISNGVHRVKIKIIGIGGGGSSIVSEIASKISPLAKDKIIFVAADTNSISLKKINPKVNRFNFGQSVTHGLGTGMDQELGKIAAQSDKEKIKKILQGQDLYILISSLGGGTGSASSSVFARISRNLGNLTYGIFTLPFKFEGEKKMEAAREALEKLKPHLSAISILPNDRIFQVVDKKTPLKNALSVINKNLADSLKSLLELIYLPGLINIDFADLKTILDFDPNLKKGKLTYLNTIELEGADKVNQAIKKLISSPLYPYTINGAKGILFNITGEKNISLAEISQISNTICEMVKGEAKIIFGVSQDNSYQDKIKITLLATDCKQKIFSGPKREISPKKAKNKKIETKSLRPKPKVNVKKKSKPKKKQKLQGRKPSSPEKLKVPVKIERKPDSSHAGQVQRTNGISFSKNNNDSSSAPFKIRRNALQIKETIKKDEANQMAQEEIWEIPAFLRRKS